MLISIIIPNYDGEKYIKQCIESVQNQTYKDYELIIIDNGSKDNSCSVIEENYPEVKLIKNKRNYGFSIAVNQGIRESRGKYVLLLNNDTLAKQDWLDYLVKCIEKDERIFSVCSKMIRYHEKEKIDDAGDGYNILGWACKGGDGQRVTASRYSNNREVFSSCAGAAIYRSRIFDEIGYFDENFFAYLEDVDISYRAKTYGYKNIYCADAKIFHIGSATSGSRHNEFKVKLAARNNIYLIYKNMPIVQLIINTPFIILGCIIKGLYFSKKKLGKAYLNGIKEAFKNLNNIDKSEFELKKLVNYIKIEFELIANTFRIFF